MSPKVHPKDSDKRVDFHRDVRIPRRRRYQQYMAIRNMMDERAAQNRQKQMAFDV